MPAILLVDDEDNLLNIGKIYLEKNTGFPVTTLPSAQDALIFLADHPVDVIVSDYQMPEMDGIEFLKAVRARGDETPFIIFTGKGREEVVIEALNSGADFYLQKGGEPKSQFVELAHKIQYAVSRRQDEGALVQKEAELHAILQGSPIPTFVIDRTHHVISWNRALEEITGIGAADVLGTTRHWQAFYDEERPCLADLLIDGKTGAIKDWYRGKCKKNFQIQGVYEATDFFPHLGKAGRWLHFTASLIRGEGEQGIGAVETLQDITRRVEAEEALRNSEERYRSVVEDQTEFICRFTPDGRLTFVNDAYCRYFNLDKNTCLTQPHSVVLPPEDAHLMKQHLASLTPDNPVALIDHRIIMPSGEIRWQRWSDRAIFDKDGQVIEYQSVGRDITERKRVEEALKESEERYRALFEGAGEGILVAGIQTKKIVRANPAICMMMGYSNEELISMGLEDIYPTKDLSRLTDEFMALARGEKTRATDIPCLRKDGTIIYADVVSSQVTIDGKMCNLGHFTDVTGRKQVEEALRASESLYRSLAEASQDLIFVIGKDDTVEYVNSSAAHLIRKQPEVIVGSPRSTMFPPSISDRQKRKLTQVFLTGNPSRSESSIVINSETRWFDHFLVPVRDKDDNIQSVLGVSRDITNRRKAEEVLRESEKQYRTLMDQVPELIIVQRDGIIHYTNPAVVKTLGYGPEEILNRPLTGFVAHEYHDRIAAALRRRMRGEKVEPYEVEILGKTGGRRTVVVSGSRIEFKGAPASLIVLTDITERKALVEAVQQANRKLNLLSSITRHDILNQLVALRGYIEISREYLDDKKTLLDFLEKEENAASTIEEQIEFTKEYQEMGVKEPLWLNVHESIKKAAIGVDKRDIPIEVDRTDLEIFADPLFDRVFYNLIDNALRYGGEVMTAIHVSSHESDEGLILICEDDGVGITEEDKKSLFTRGFGKHTGLGLFLTREILAITGITITENGTPGKGARFEITVPKGLYRFTDLVSQ